MELLLGERYEAEKMEECFQGNQYTSVKESGAGQNGPREEHRHQTRQKIADEAGVSEAAIKRYAQFAKGVAVAEGAAPGFRQKILDGEVKPTQQEMQTIAKGDPAERKSIIDQVFHRRRKSLNMVRGRGRKKASTAATPETEENRLCRVQRREKRDAGAAHPQGQRGAHPGPGRTGQRESPGAGARGQIAPAGAQPRM